MRFGLILSPHILLSKMVFARRKAWVDTLWKCLDLCRYGVLAIMEVKLQFRQKSKPWALVDSLKEIVLAVFVLILTNEWCHSYSSVPQSCPTLCDPMNHSMPSFPVRYQLPEFHVHWVGDAIQPSHPLSSPSPPALNLSQHQGLFQWVSSLHQVAKVLEFQLQHQSLQWIPRTDLL